MSAVRVFSGKGVCTVGDLRREFDSDIPDGATIATTQVETYHGESIWLAVVQLPDTPPVPTWLEN